MRLGARSSTRPVGLLHQPRGELGRSVHLLAQREVGEQRAGREPSRSLDSAPSSAVFGLRRSAPPPRPRRRRTGNRRRARAPADWARCPCGSRGTGRRRAAGRSPRAARASDSGRRRGSARPAPARALPAGRASSRAKARVSSFPDAARNAGRARDRCPPWPGSITTIGRPGDAGLGDPHVGRPPAPMHGRAAAARLAESAASLAPPAALASATTAPATSADGASRASIHARFGPRPIATAAGPGP